MSVNSNLNTPREDVHSEGGDKLLLPPIKNKESSKIPEVTFIQSQESQLNEEIKSMHAAEPFGKRISM